MTAKAKPANARIRQKVLFKNRSTVLSLYALSKKLPSGSMPSACAQGKQTKAATLRINCSVCFAPDPGEPIDRYSDRLVGGSKGICKVQTIIQFIGPWAWRLLFICLGNLW